LKQTFFHNGEVLSTTEMTPIERFVSDKLEELFDKCMDGSLNIEEAKKALDFLVTLQPYIDQEKS